METLIKLAKEKGFISHFNKEWKYSSKEPLRQLFELTELQQWLRDIYEIHIEVGNYAFGYYPMLNNTSPPYKLEFKDKRWNRSNKENLDFNTYEKALEKGLLEALKLI